MVSLSVMLLSVPFSGTTQAILPRVQRFTLALTLSVLAASMAVAQQPQNVIREAQPRPAQGSGPAAATPPSFPNGATSIQETYQDWQVSCVVQGNDKRCVIAHQQTDAQSRQRILAIELQPTPTGIAGVFVLPFGLVVDRAPTLQIDDRTSSLPLRFHTCLPVGCLVPLSLDQAALNEVRGGSQLKLKALADNGREIEFVVSLRGLGAAIDRARALL